MEMAYSNFLGLSVGCLTKISNSLFARPINATTMPHPRFKRRKMGNIAAVERFITPATLFGMIYRKTNLL